MRICQRTELCELLLGRRSHCCCCLSSIHMLGMSGQHTCSKFSRVDRVPWPRQLAGMGSCKIVECSDSEVEQVRWVLQGLHRETWVSVTQQVMQVSLQKSVSTKMGASRATPMGSK